MTAEGKGGGDADADWLQGQAKFTHDKTKPKLEISVNLNPQSQASQSQARGAPPSAALRADARVSPHQDVASLSGGETSFATVSLLLAMWEVMEPPFRILVRSRRSAPLVGC